MDTPIHTIKSHLLTSKVFDVPFCIKRLVLTPIDAPDGYGEVFMSRKVDGTNPKNGQPMKVIPADLMGIFGRRKTIDKKAYHEHGVDASGKPLKNFQVMRRRLVSGAWQATPWRDVDYNDPNICVMSGSGDSFKSTHRLQRFYFIDIHFGLDENGKQRSMTFNVWNPTTEKKEPITAEVFRMAIQAEAIRPSKAGLCIIDLLKSKGEEAKNTLLTFSYDESGQYTLPILNLADLTPTQATVKLAAAQEKINSDSEGITVPTPTDVFTGVVEAPPVATATANESIPEGANMDEYNPLF
jgi:hypothetical protein